MLHQDPEGGAVATRVGASDEEGFVGPWSCFGRSRQDHTLSFVPSQCNLLHSLYRLRLIIRIFFSLTVEMKGNGAPLIVCKPSILSGVTSLLWFLN